MFFLIPRSMTAIRFPLPLIWYGSLQDTSGMGTISQIVGVLRASETAYSPSSLPTTSAARIVPWTRVLMVRARVSTPVIPRRPFSSKKDLMEGCAAGFSQISRVTHPRAQTFLFWKFCTSTP